jgi:hypothetical protein
MREISRTVDERIQQRMRQSGRIFLKEVIPLIPVWTGEAIGSLKPIAEALHVALPIVKSYPDSPMGGVEKGRAQSIGEGGIQKEGYRYVLNFGSRVAHFNINDRYDVSQFGIKLRQPTPWQSFDRGIAVSRNYLKNNLKRLIPKYADLTYKTRIYYGG